MLFFSGLLKGRLGKHPIHLILVHFPSALIPFSLVLDLTGLYLNKTSFIISATYALVGGTSMALLAGFFGAIDYFKINHKKPEWKIASWHALLNISWVMIWTGLSAYKLKLDLTQETISITYLLILGFSVLGMIVSNYLGGELVLKFDLGKDQYQRE